MSMPAGDVVTGFVSKSVVLNAAWERQRAMLEEMRIAVEGAPQFDSAPEQRARAYHQLMEAQAIGYNFALAPRMPHPRIFRNTAWQTDVYCSGGNGPDFAYATVFLDGTQTYRLTANIRDSKMLLAQHNSALPGSPDSHMIANYDFADFDVEADGSFTVTLSADKAEGNWLPLARDAEYQWLLFRPSIEGWDKVPTELHIERISPVAPGYYDEHEFSEAHTAKRIDAATDYIRYIVQEWMLDFYQRVRANSKGVNLFASIGPAISGEVGSPTAEYVLAAFEVNDDEALIIEILEPPNGVYWGIQIFDVWLRSIDFRTMQTTLNAEQVSSDADGAIRLVLSRQDPGVAHWLDTAGYGQGQMLIRNYRSSRPAKPMIRRVNFDELDRYLPQETKRVTREERVLELARRRAAYLRRHGE